MYPDAEARLGPEWGGESVVQGAWDIRVTRAIWILSLALVLYDYVLTFGDEVNWMWNGKFLWTRVLFAVSRYWTIVNLVIHNVVLALSSPPDRVCILLTSVFKAWFAEYLKQLCRVWYFYVVFATAGTSLTTTIISQLRIYAMYNCNRKLLMAMGAAVSLSFGLQGPVLLIMVIRAETFRLPPVYTGCFAADPYPYLLPYWVQWMPYLTYECFIFVLAIYNTGQLSHQCSRKTFNIQRLHCALYSTILYSRMQDASKHPRSSQSLGSI
ncbi:unnamed protein product [Somion occarium]|uniref:DUF6533 domain-containing protein n=1 Tax=Somion occarium TaxID=3059160 RepID=A0ABP1CSH5_9APHY